MPSPDSHNRSLPLSSPTNQYSGPGKCVYSLSFQAFYEREAGKIRQEGRAEGEEEEEVLQRVMEQWDEMYERSDEQGNEDQAGEAAQDTAQSLVQLKNRDSNRSAKHEQKASTSGKKRRSSTSARADEASKEPRSQLPRSKPYSRNPYPTYTHTTSFLFHSSWHDSNTYIHSTSFSYAGGPSFHLQNLYFSLGTNYRGGWGEAGGDRWASSDVWYGQHRQSDARESGGRSEKSGELVRRK
ncbi:hypothetical protein OF846_002503 [Rhodotorula toruloides]|nr:hypothetical protein OF846_002503 [Rhodotorula toruloides]